MRERNSTERHENSELRKIHNICQIAHKLSRQVNAKLEPQPKPTDNAKQSGVGCLPIGVRSSPLSFFGPKSYIASKFE